MQITTTPRQRRGARPQRGATLIELMVGMLIGLLVTIVITQVLALAEGQKRSTTSGSDAQVNGALALYTLQRDVQMAGYGLSGSPMALGCPIRASFNGTALPTMSLVPVRITDGASGAPDTIEILSSSKNSFSVPVRVAEDHPRTAANFFVQSTLAIVDGDMMIAVPAQVDANNWCSLFNVTGLGGAAGGGNGGGQGQNQVIHNSGTGGSWNQPGGQSIFPASGYNAGSTLINIGQMVNRIYSINSRNALQSQAFNIATPTAPVTNELYPQIVNLQAMYGKDTNADGVVDTYDNVQPTTASGWAQTLAVRVMLVARSGQFEKDLVTTVQPLWDVGTAIAVAGTATCGASKCLTVKVDQDSDWQHYRYKVYDTVIPLRNLLWHS